MRTFCGCGHSEARHTGAPLALPFPAAVLVTMAFTPFPGKACERCECQGFVARAWRAA